MGSKIVRRGKKGTFWYMAHWNGREIRFSLKTTDEKQAEREQRIHDAKYTDPHFTAPRRRNPEVAEYWTTYQQWAASHGRAANTLATQQYFWDLFVEIVKPARLADVDRRSIETFKAALLKRGMKPRSVNNALKDLQAIWNRGLKEGWTTIANPVLGVERYKLTRELPTPHTADELNRLLAEATKIGHNTAWVVLLGGWAGLRKNEILSARWEWFCFDEKPPQIRVKRFEGFELKDHEERAIKMAQRIVDAMEPHAKPSGPVFESGRASEGKNRYGFEPKRSLSTALKNAGLSQADPFQRLRQTFACLHAAGGEDLYILSRWLGHYSVKVTERYYLMADANAGNIDKF